MSDTVIHITSARVDEARICTPHLGEDPNDCSSHSHVRGHRRLILEVEPDRSDDDTAAAFIALMGRPARVVPA